MHPIQQLSPQETAKNSAIACQRILDSARASAMENLLNAGSLINSLKQVSNCLEKVLNSCHCQVIPYNPRDKAYKIIGLADCAHSKFVLNITEQLLNKAEGTIATNLRDNQDCIFTNIHQSKIWQDLHSQAKALAIQAAWIIPLVSANGQICGGYLCLFNSIRPASEDELKLLDSASQSACAMLSQGRLKTKSLKTQICYQKQLTEQQVKLDEMTAALNKAINQRHQVQTQLLELESLAALGTMMSSLTHEVNTPIGVSITASSFLNDLQQDCFEKLKNDQLKLSELKSYLQDSKEASEIILRNVSRADELIKTFKRLAIDQDSQDLRSFNLCDYVYEVLLSLKPRLKQTRQHFCINIPTDLTIYSNPGALSQLLTNLIMNSVQHAFMPDDSGQITISAKIKSYKHKNTNNQETENNTQELSIVYKDNGIGMDIHTIENMYKPFFTLAANNDGCGLGMHICNNIVMKTLHGTINCQSTPNKGSQFTIQLPLSSGV